MPASQLPPIGRSSLGGAPWSGRSFQILKQRALTHDRNHEQGRADEQDPFFADALHREVRDQGADERSGAAARSDHAEQALRLPAVEDLEQEAPEHGDQEQVDDTDEDVERLADERIDVARAELHSDGREHDSDDSVDPWQERAAPKASDDRAVERNQQDREQRRVEPKIGGCVATDECADRFADRPDREVAGPHEEEKKKRGDDGGDFMGLDRGEACQQRADRRAFCFFRAHDGRGYTRPRGAWNRADNSCARTERRAPRIP